MRKVGGWDWDLDWDLDWDQDQGRQMQQDSGGSLGCGCKGNKKKDRRRSLNQYSTSTRKSAFPGTDPPAAQRFFWASI